MHTNISVDRVLACLLTNWMQTQWKFSQHGKFHGLSLTLSISACFPFILLFFFCCFVYSFLPLTEYRREHVTCIFSSCALDWASMRIAQQFGWSPAFHKSVQHVLKAGCIWWFSVYCDVEREQIPSKHTHTASAPSQIHLGINIGNMILPLVLRHA